MTQIPQDLSMSSAFQNVSSMTGYTTGEEADTPWGHWKVLDAGMNQQEEEFCRKSIRVEPQKALSLQSHDHRREHWMVKSGTLTVILDGERLTLNAGEDIRIPVGSVHTMANLADAPCVVEELQEGLCREKDIHRFGTDMFGRATETSDDPKITKSITLFDEILKEIGIIPPAKTSPAQKL
jgi:mannose-6-phosphate isomerase